MFKKLGLIKGRHELPVEEYLLEEVITEYTQKALTPMIDARLKDLGFEQQQTQQYDQHYNIRLWVEKAPVVQLYLTGLTIVSLLAVKKLNWLGYNVETYDYSPASGEYYCSANFQRDEFCI